MTTHSTDTSEPGKPQAIPGGEPHGGSNGFLETTSRRTAAMSKDRAREHIATLVVLSVLEIAVAFLVLSHAPAAGSSLADVSFLLSLCLTFNGGLVLICLKRISQADGFPHT